MSTKKNKITKLPAEWLTQKLPIPPAGYSYEYKGTGPFFPRPNWLDSAISTSSRLKHRGWLEGELCGDSEQHYFALVKHPAPKPAAVNKAKIDTALAMVAESRPKMNAMGRAERQKLEAEARKAIAAGAKVKKTKAIMADCPICTAYEIYGDGTKSLKCIAHMQDKAARAIHREFNLNEGERTPWIGLHKFQREKYSRYAYAVLASLGIIAPKKGRK